MKALVALALAVQEGERSSNTVSPTTKKALEKYRLESEEAASNDIVELMRRIEDTKLATRATIRKLKAQTNAAVKGLNDLDRRWDYAQETDNFLPVLAYFGSIGPSDLSNPEDFAKLTTVPDDWKPSTPAEETPVEGTPAK